MKARAGRRDPFGEQPQGFTLLEVMIGLALLGFALVVLLKSAAGSIFNAQQAQMMGVVTDLARAKMNDIEETLLKDGFNETGLADADDACDDWEPFEEEGWPNVRWCAKVVQVELPSWQNLQELTQARAAAGSAARGSDADADEAGGFENSALGGLLSMMGGGIGAGGASTDIESLAGGGLVQSYYTMFQEILKVSVRKVTLVVEWEIMGRKRDLVVVAFFTDAAAMDKVLQGLGSQELPDNGAGSGSGSGAGSGSGRGSGGRGGGGIGGGGIGGGGTGRGSGGGGR